MWEAVKMLETIPKSIPLEFGKNHGDELLEFFMRCRKRGIGWVSQLWKFYLSDTKNTILN